MTSKSALDAVRKALNSLASRSRTMPGSVTIWITETQAVALHDEVCVAVHPEQPAATRKEKVARVKNSALFGCLIEVLPDPEGGGTVVLDLTGEHWG